MHDSVDQEDYKRAFLSNDESKVYIDATPSYSDDSTTALLNFKHLIQNDDALLIFCIRQPFARAYSHYMHDLTKNFWNYGFSYYPFEDPRVFNRYLRKIGPTISKTIELFGQERVYCWSAVDESAPVINAIAEFSDLPNHWDLASSISRHAGGWIPQLYYDSDSHIIVMNGANIYLLPPSTLLLVNGEWSKLLTGFPRDIGNKLMVNSRSWTRSFDFSLFGTKADALIDDYYYAKDIGRVQTDEIFLAQPISAKYPPTLPEYITSQLVCLGDIGTVDNRDLSGTPGSIGVRIDQIEAAYRRISSSGLLKEKYEYEFYNLLKTTIIEYGPIPEYLAKFTNWSLNMGNPEDILQVLFKLNGRKY